MSTEGGRRASFLARWWQRGRASEESKAQLAPGVVAGINMDSTLPRNTC